MTVLDRSGESVARFISRRRFIKGAAVGIFGAVSAWATMSPQQVKASHCGSWPDSSNCQCNPPGGRYCSSGSCSGSSCVSPCTYNYTWYPSTACWCTATCCNGPANRGYYKCCDCTCSGTACGCRKYIQTGTNCPSAPQP